MLGRLLQKTPEDSADKQPAERFLTTAKYPLYYFAITKCGSTYLKNLLYALDHGGDHPEGDSVHSADEDLCRAGPDMAQAISASPYAFTVLRDPVERFLSLYFDKIYGTGPNNFSDIRQTLAEETGLDLSPELGTAEHRDNALKLITWVERNLDGKTEEAINPHWRRQSSRLQRVKDIRVEYLTLEGLDAQLPYLLEPLIPEIRAVAAAVKTRNRIPRPVSSREILTDELVARIHRVYASDLRQWRKAQELWGERLGSTTPKTTPDRSRLRVLTTQTLPLYYQPTAKAGCTYVRNLFYAIDHGKTYARPLEIQTAPELVSAYASRDQIAEGVGFFVLRDPFQRFLSLYFDKVWGSGPHAFPWIAKRLGKGRGFHAEPDITAEQHRFNCNRFLGYLEFRFARQKPRALNPHWRPQIETARAALDFGLVPLLLEELDRQLPQVAGEFSEAVQASMRLQPERNKAPRPFPADEILSPRIRNRISALYAGDIALYDRARESWAATGRPPRVTLD